MCRMEKKISHNKPSLDCLKESLFDRCNHQKVCVQSYKNDWIAFCEQLNISLLQFRCAAKLLFFEISFHILLEGTFWGKIVLIYVFVVQRSFPAKQYKQFQRIIGILIRPCLSPRFDVTQQKILFRKNENHVQRKKTQNLRRNYQQTTHNVEKGCGQ